MRERVDSELPGVFRWAAVGRSSAQTLFKSLDQTRRDPRGTGCHTRKGRELRAEQRDGRVVRGRGAEMKPPKEAEEERSVKEDARKVPRGR